MTTKAFASWVLVFAIGCAAQPAGESARSRSAGFATEELELWEPQVVLAALPSAGQPSEGDALPQACPVTQGSGPQASADLLQQGALFGLSLGAAGSQIWPLPEMRWPRLRILNLREYFRLRSAANAAQFSLPAAPAAPAVAAAASSAAAIILAQAAILVGGLLWAPRLGSSDQCPGWTACGEPSLDDVLWRSLVQTAPIAGCSADWPRGSEASGWTEQPFDAFAKDLDARLHAPPWEQAFDGVVLVSDAAESFGDRSAFADAQVFGDLRASMVARSQRARLGSIVPLELQGDARLAAVVVPKRTGYTEDARYAVAVVVVGEHLVATWQDKREAVSSAAWALALEHTSERGLEPSLASDPDVVYDFRLLFNPLLNVLPDFSEDGVRRRRSLGSALVAHEEAVQEVSAEAGIVGGALGPHVGRELLNDLMRRLNEHGAQRLLRFSHARVEGRWVAVIEYLDGGFEDLREQAHGLGLPLTEVHYDPHATDQLSYDPLRGWLTINASALTQFARGFLTILVGHLVHLRTEQALRNDERSYYWAGGVRREDDVWTFDRLARYELVALHARNLAEAIEENAMPEDPLRNLLNSIRERGVRANAVTALFAAHVQKRLQAYLDQLPEDGFSTVNPRDESYQHDDLVVIPQRHMGGRLYLYMWDRPAREANAEVGLLLGGFVGPSFLRDPSKPSTVLWIRSRLERLRREAAAVQSRADTRFRAAKPIGLD